jgi:hypothetical protein
VVAVMLEELCELIGRELLRVVQIVVIVVICDDNQAVIDPIRLFFGRACFVIMLTGEGVRVLMLTIFFGV